MINVAIDAAKQGGQLALSYFLKQLKVNFKPDNSPVTIADKKAEKLIRGIISRKFPDHGIIGEEFPAINPKAKYQWIIDPIDGTRDFARGIQFWCTLIALLENGKPILGVTYFPYSNEVFSAQKGKGAYLNGKRTYVSKINNLKYSYLSISSAYHFATHSKLKNLVKLGESAGAARYISSFSFNYLWKGKIEGYVVGRGGIWDFAAPSIITEEAGGKFSDFNGKNSLDSNCAVFTNGKIHAGVINILKNS